MTIYKDFFRNIMLICPANWPHRTGLSHSQMKSNGLFTKWKTVFFSFFPIYNFHSWRRKWNCRGKYHEKSIKLFLFYFPVNLKIFDFPSSFRSFLLCFCVFRLSSKLFYLLIKKKFSHSFMSVTATRLHC